MYSLHRGFFERQADRAECRTGLRDRLKARQRLAYKAMKGIEAIDRPGTVAHWHERAALVSSKRRVFCWTVGAPESVFREDIRWQHLLQNRNL